MTLKHPATGAHPPATGAAIARRAALLAVRTGKPHSAARKAKAGNSAPPRRPNYYRAGITGEPCTAAPPPERGDYAKRQDATVRTLELFLATQRK